MAKNDAKLVAAGPAYDVRNADLITGAAYGPSLGTMLDLCGFAGVKIRPANSSFVRYLRSQGVGRNDSYEGGYWVSAQTHRQEISVNEAWASAFAEVLRAAGIDAWMDSRLD